MTYYPEEGPPLELGASILFDQNYYVNNFTKQVSLTTKNTKDFDRFVIFDGKDVLVQTSGNKWLDVFKMLWRYWWAPLKFKALPARTFEDFKKIYSL